MIFRGVPDPLLPPPSGSAHAVGQAILILDYPQRSGYSVADLFGNCLLLFFVVVFLLLLFLFFFFWGGGGGVCLGLLFDGVGFADTSSFIALQASCC